MMLTTLGRYHHLGLLILRLGIGLSFVYRGFWKLAAGPDLWAGLGGAMGNLGVHFAPAVFGFAASLTEFLGGVFLALGLLFRPATALLAFVMFVATLHHVHAGDPFGDFSHPLELAIVFVSLFLIGAGKHSLDERIWPSKP